MSERGSFVTEYIYCKKCFESAKRILLEKEKYLCSIALPNWVDGEEMPIIAGKIGGLYSGEELDSFEYFYDGKLEKVLCHSMRIAVIAENGEQIFTINPKKEERNG